MELKSEPKMNESAKSKVFNGVTINIIRRINGGKPGLF